MRSTRSSFLLSAAGAAGALVAANGAPLLAASTVRRPLLASRSLYSYTRPATAELAAAMRKTRVPFVVDSPSRTLLVGSLDDGPQTLRGPQFCITPPPPQDPTESTLIWVPTTVAPSAYANANSAFSWGNFVGQTTPGYYGTVPEKKPIIDCAAWVAALAAQVYGMATRIFDNRAAYSATVVRAAGAALASTLTAVEFFGVLIAGLTVGEFVILLAGTTLVLGFVLGCLIECG